MRRLALALSLLTALPALAQKELFFNTGRPLVFKEADMDRRFAKSHIGKALATGTDDPNCQQVLSALFMLLGEIAPYLHNRDENFTMDPVLLEAAQTQLSLPHFPALAYLTAMVRRVRIEKKLPDAWLETATQLNETARFIDLGKLRMLNEAFKPVDSFIFTLPALKSRYIEEVINANSAVTTDVAAAFHDAYVDRQVAWGQAMLIDAGLNKKKQKKGKRFDPTQMEEIVAILQWVPPDPAEKELIFTRKLEKPPPITVYARLAPKQFLDLERVPRTKRLLVKGRFWEMSRDVSEVEVREALIFEDRNWNGGVLLAQPDAVAQCPMAINQLTGLAPSQPGGFKH